jgi:hypothetical protein
MIRYDIADGDLRDLIDAANSTWFTRAEERTEHYRDVEKYDGSMSDIWSDIKRVFMDVQGFKCGFCERRLERSGFGNVEHDVEHFRPKAKVAVWPPASQAHRADGLGFGLGAGSEGLGYYLLSHDPDNYLISCKTCNSAFKGNGFPVAGARQLDMGDPRNNSEAPFLCYPIGSFDDDPMDLIRFNGYLPVPAAAGGHRRRRGQVLIRFFDLAVREGLIEERSTIITTLFVALEARSNPASALHELGASTLIDAAQSDRAPHANCARSFVQTWNTDRQLATTYADAAMEYLSTL